MIVEITGLERGTKMNSKGKPMEMLTLTGIKIQDGEPAGEYERIVYEWKNPDELLELEKAGIGATVNLWFTQNGRFQDLTKVEVMSEGTGVSSGGKKPETKPETKKTSSSGSGKGSMASPAEVIVAPAPAAVVDEKSEALRQAVALTDSLLSSDERFKKLLPATKTTVDIVIQLTLENASKFEAFLTGKKSGKVESDGSDLKPESVDAEEPTLPGEDD
jgi:hypothetical protein